MSKFSTEQEQFWAGDFGNAYAERNILERLLPARLALFSRILSSTRNVRSAIEFGANVGTNMHALKALIPGVELDAVEINNNAFEQLKNVDGVNAHHGSILEFEPLRQWDFSFTKGVLIHINPEMLALVYERLYQSTNRYLMVMEYYNPTPVVVEYRGHSERLFKRDFAGELLDAYPDLRLLDYGFCYHRDNNFPQDDGNWFLLEKEAAR